MNGLIHENIVASVNVPCFADFCNNLELRGFAVILGHSSWTKGYVSRVPGREPLLIGWSSKFNSWYALVPSSRSTSYCLRLYFHVYDHKFYDRFLSGDSDDDCHKLIWYGEW